MTHLPSHTSPTSGTRPVIDKWSAFWLSLAVPGAGQLGAAHMTCLAWFLAVGAAIAGWQCFAAIAPPWLFRPGQILSLAALAVLSAEHARRLFDPNRPSCACSAGAGGATSARIIPATARGRAMSVGLVLETALTLGALWQRVADLQQFLVIDPFHEHIEMRDRVPGPGTELVLWHNALGRRFARRGRILSWQPGQGYALSDLSARDRRDGFPHVFFVTVTTLSATRSRLAIVVRGRWTSRWIPAWCGRLWLTLVCRDHARLLRKVL